MLLLSVNMYIISNVETSLGWAGPSSARAGAGSFAELDSTDTGMGGEMQNKANAQPACPAACSLGLAEIGKLSYMQGAWP